MVIEIGFFNRTTLQVMRLTLGTVSFEKGNAAEGRHQRAAGTVVPTS